VRYAKENGLKIELQTNGALLSDKKYANKLIDAGVLHFFIPLHSHQEEISNLLTNSKDFKKTVAGIKNVMAKASLVISHVITSKNYQDLAKFVDFVAKEFGSKVIIYFGFVRPNGNALDNKWVVPKLADTEFFLYSAFNKCKELNIEFSVEGIPLCYMQGYEMNNDETKRLFGQNFFHLEGNEIREDTHKKHFLEDKSRNESCDSCLLDAVCPKVWKEYSNIFGTGELFPVFDHIVLKKLSEKYG
jgi:MoaA/NifB/PqqE/SkfB family radical SAM enzyme